MNKNLYSKERVSVLTLISILYYPMIMGLMVVAGFASDSGLPDHIFVDIFSWGSWVASKLIVYCFGLAVLSYWLKHYLIAFICDVISTVVMICVGVSFLGFLGVLLLGA